MSVYDAELFYTFNMEADMNNKSITFIWTVCGIAGGEDKIIPPEIDKRCPKCSHKMELIDARGFLNSLTNSLTAKCTNCGEIEKFHSIKLWKKCIEIWENKNNS